jgi:hypothetical protein
MAEAQAKIKSRSLALGVAKSTAETAAFDSVTEEGDEGGQLVSAIPRLL